MESKWSQLVETANTIGHKYIVNVGVALNLLGEPDIWNRAADVFNHAGELSKRAGIQFAYDNHHLEFLPVNGKKPYDLLLEPCDPDLVKMEIDFCWMAAAEHDPFIYFQRFPGRFPLAHVKQLRKLPTRTPGDEVGIVLLKTTTPDITEVGEGVIDWKSPLRQSIQFGTQHFFVEHDAPQSPLESIQTSYDYLEKLRF